MAILRPRTSAIVCGCTSATPWAYFGWYLGLSPHRAYLDLFGLWWTSRRATEHVWRHGMLYCGSSTRPQQPFCLCRPPQAAVFWGSSARSVGDLFFGGGIVCAKRRRCFLRPVFLHPASWGVVQTSASLVHRRWWWWGRGERRGHKLENARGGGPAAFLF